MADTEVNKRLTAYSDNDIHEMHGNLVRFLGDVQTAMAAVIRKGAVYKESGNTCFAEYAKIKEEERQLLEKKTGLDLSKITSHQIDVSGISHAEGEHGINGNALSKFPSQIPLDLDDYLLIPEIVANSKEIQYGGKDRHGRNLIKYRYVKGNEYYLFEEVRQGRGKLTTKTLYKNKMGTPTVLEFSEDSSKVLPLTSKTLRTRALNNNLAQNVGNSSEMNILRHDNEKTRRQP